ncbi:MAG: ribosomal L7Ae/L30e/S12e/Gadd45 family protein [Gemmatimonadaceae bacterium]
MDEEVSRRVLRLVGLGVRSRGAVVGVEQVRQAAKKGKLALAVVASDASQHSLSKVVPLLEALRVRVVRAPSAADLGQAVGREQTAAVGIVDRQLAQGIRELVDSAPRQS